MDEKLNELETNMAHMAKIINTISHRQEIMNFAIQSICASIPSDQREKLALAIQEQRDVVQTMPLQNNDSPARKADLLAALTDLETILTGAKAKLAWH